MDLTETCELRLSSISGPFKEFLIIRGAQLIEGTSTKSSARRVIVVKAKLSQLAIEPAPGQHWRIEGIAQEKQVYYGDYQLEELYFDTPKQLDCILPDDGEGFIRFLAKEPGFIGIGEVKARKIWETFGESLFNILEAKDRSKLVKYLEEKSAQALINGYEKYANLKYTTLLKKLGVPLPIQMRLIKYHGPQSVARIQKNPYVLTFFGMSFFEADNLAHKIYKINLDDPRRIGAATEECLRALMSNGHTAVSSKELEPYLRKLLGSEQLVKLALTDKKSKAYVLRGGLYISIKIYIMAQVIAKRISKLTLQNVKWRHAEEFAVSKAIKSQPYDLTDKQILAVKSSVLNRISCICGGAGTGKTTVLRTVIFAYQHLGYDVFAVALSGRASLRLHESTGFPTRTIASFLDKRTPQPDPQKPSVLIVDEASMLDTVNFYQLICELVADKHRIILVGDDAQLPPIGPGAVLRDILKCGRVSTVNLDIVQRSSASTGIPEYSNYLRSMQIPPSLSTSNVKFHQVNEDQIEEACVKLYSIVPQSSQIVAYTRRMVKSINKKYQSQFNAQSETLKYELNGDTFLTEIKLGDKVLISKNDISLGVQNGTLATLVKVERKGDSIGELLLDTGKKINITINLLDDLSLGYAVTLHKAQGSQFPIIIVAVEEVGSLLDNSWVYTAVTRAELAIHIVGNVSTFTKAISSPGSQQERSTILSYLLSKL